MVPTLRYQACGLAPSRPCLGDRGPFRLEGCGGGSSLWHGRHFHLSAPKPGKAVDAHIVVLLVFVDALWSQMVEPSLHLRSLTFIPILGNAVTARVGDACEP